MEKFGTVQSDGSVLEDDGKRHYLPRRGTDTEGYPEVLLEATLVGGHGSFSRQSVKHFVGMRVKFYKVSDEFAGYNHEIVET